MKVNRFDIVNGIYAFELASVETVFHAHPAVEVVFSKKADLTIETKEKKYENISVAIIDSNVAHRISGKEGLFSLLMIECGSNFLSSVCEELGLKKEQGIYTSKASDQWATWSKQKEEILTHSGYMDYQDEVVLLCLKYLNSTDAAYVDMMTSLQSIVHLSESRISHVFKEKVGISIKKYLVWSRLKKAFQLVVKEEVSMYEAALQSGFYDQAHLSKAFKQFLGLTPSKVYNSRTLQE